MGGTADGDTWGRFHSSDLGGCQKIMVTCATKSIEKKGGPAGFSEYLKMCAGKAIEDGLLQFPSGTYVLWHWEGCHKQNFSSEIDAAVKYGQLGSGVSGCLVIGGRVVKEKTDGGSREWLLAAKGHALKEAYDFLRSST